MKKIVTLTKTELAYVAIVLEEHQALIRNADAKRDGRMLTVLEEKGIPRDAHVTVDGGTSTLNYEAPDIETQEVPEAPAEEVETSR